MQNKMRKLVFDAMEAKVTDPELTQSLQEAGLENTYEQAIALAAVQKAAKGDLAAAKFLRDILEDYETGHKPVRAMDLQALSDRQLKRLADMTDGDRDA